MRGFTLVELLVALALSATLVLAATASLVLAQRGFHAVDASAQMRENSRFAIEIIQRIALQAGYHDPVSAEPVSTSGAIFGMDNVLAKLSSNHSDALTAADFVSRSNPTPSRSDSKCASNADTACNNGSDALAIRFRATADGSMVSCAGIQLLADEPVVNLFHIAKNSANGEPSLMCSYFSSASRSWITQSLVDGVESFQVLYGVDSNGDSVPEQFKNATQIAHAGSRWESVQILRIGLLMRGPPNSAPVKGTTLPTQCTLGLSHHGLGVPSSGGLAVLATEPKDCIDPPSTLTNGAASTGAEFPRGGVRFDDDGRMRQVVVFTVSLRNAL